MSQTWETILWMVACLAMLSVVYVLRVSANPESSRDSIYYNSHDCPVDRSQIGNWQDQGFVPTDVSRILERGKSPPAFAAWRFVAAGTWIHQSPANVEEIILEIPCDYLQDRVQFDTFVTLVKSRVVGDLAGLRSSDALPQHVALVHRANASVLSQWLRANDDARIMMHGYRFPRLLSVTSDFPIRETDKAFLGILVAKKRNNRDLFEFTIKEELRP